MNLVGEYPVSVEGVDGLAVPEAYLRVMGRQLVLRADAAEGYLFSVWPAAECDANAEAVQADDAGSIRIPARFLEGVDTDELVICGNMDHLECWTEESWADFCSSMDLEALLGDAPEDETGACEEAGAPDELDAPDDFDGGIDDKTRKALERLRDIRYRRNIYGAGLIGLDPTSPVNPELAESSYDRFLEDQKTEERRDMLYRTLDGMEADERKALRLRLGLEDETPHTLDEVSAATGMEKDDIRLAEAKALTRLRRMQYPCHQMRDLLEDD